MAEAEKVIRIRIDASGAQTGARQVGGAIDNVKAKAAGLVGANDNAAGSFNRLGSAMGGASKHGAAMQGILGGIQGRAASTVPVIGNLVSTLAGMGPQAAVVAAVGAAFAIVAAKAVQAAAQVQSWKASLQTVTGSAEAADSAYRGLVQFAANTPFTLDQSIEGFTKLRSLGLSTSEEIMTSYGNTSAAMGKSMTQMVEAVADATTGEFERLKEFGIKAKSEGDNVAFTFQGVTKTVGKNAKEIEKYLIDIGNTKFASAMALQMQTLNAAFSNLEDSIFQMFARMGEGELGDLVKDIVQIISAGVSSITPLLGGIMDFFGGILRAVWEVTKGVAQFFTVGFGGAEGAGNVLDTLGVAFSVVGQVASIVGKVIGSVFGVIAQTAGMVVGLIQSAFQKLFGWMLPSFDLTGQSAGESLMGILRAGEFIANTLPDVFATALKEIKSMFVSAGQALAASLTGDFSLWDNVDLSFSKTKAASAAMRTEAGKIFADQKANRAMLDDLRGDFGGGNIDYDALGGTPSGAQGGGSAGKNAEAEKKRLADEFWETLKNQAATAALLPIEAENLTKQQELQKILGRDLAKDEQDRVNAAMQLIRTNEFLTSAKEASAAANRKAGIEEELTRKRIAGMSEEQLEVERAVLEFRTDALAEGLDLEDERYRKAEEQLRIDEQRLAIQEKINAQLSRATGLADQYSQTYRTAQETIGFAKDREAARVAYNSGEYGTGEVAERTYREVLEGIDDASKEGGRRMKEELGFAIEDLGSMIKGSWGKAISGLGYLIQDMVAASRGDVASGGLMGGIAGVLSSALGDEKGSIAKGYAEATEKTLTGLFKGETWTKPLSSMTSSFADFKGSLGSIFGKGGDFMKGMGNVLGTLGAGAQMGGMVAGVGKALWGKFSTTGAQVGGAIGNIFGPIGGMIGSTLGGIVGGAFKKTKWGAADITANGVTTRGNNGTSIDGAVAASGNITDSLARIADTLGGNVGDFGRIVIGQRHDDWRVNATGTSLKKKKGATEFDDDQEGAIRYALSLAIERGAITGIRASTNRLLKAGSDIEAQLEKALQFEGVFKSLDALKDPVQAAISGLNTEFEQLTGLFKEAGASAAEWANLEEYRSLKMQELMKQETSTLRDLLKDLNGEAGGASPLSLLTRDMADLAKFQTDIAAGKSVDQGEYSDLVGSILDNASIYGANSTEYQAIIEKLRGATEGAIENIESRFENDPTTNAIMDGTNATVSAIGQTNDILSRIEERLAATNTNTNSSGPWARAAARNGKLLAY